MNRYRVDYDTYAGIARRAAAEGAVLLKNDNQTLPLQEGARVAVFGRMQLHYVKSGTGSGGLVNTRYVVGILDALKQENITLNTALMQVYDDWVGTHPFDLGKGWAQEPWSQEEMPLDTATVQAAAAQSDTAIVIIGRTAGEDRDAEAVRGSYYLSDIEEDMLKKVTAHFSKVAVLLNVGSIMDMSWVETYAPSAVLYVWQGGQEGGNGVADVLMGRVNPCGKLTDTVARALSDYPAHGHFGDALQNVYAEDIYVGYRYFETFAKDRVLYPFGFGLSYTDFAITAQAFTQDDTAVSVTVTVQNTGKVAGREVAQVYVAAPQGVLGKPAVSLVAYHKTALLAAGDSETVTLRIPLARLASYDDSGDTGYGYSYVLEAGEYRFLLGNSSRHLTPCGQMTLAQTKVVETLSSSAAPKCAFDRLKPQFDVKNATYIPTYEPTPLRTQSVAEHIAAETLPAVPFTGDKGYKLGDVYDGKVSLETFVAQLTDEDMCHIVKGEGMSSPKVTPGTAAAFGGLTGALSHFGIPCGCCADGPSGIRMDCGTIAFSLPGGVCLASTFDDALNTELFTMEGAELRHNCIDTLLGPGMNIHRYPLNGRNFEYFSEDPLLTGNIAAAQLRGLAQYGVTGTIKHFACNNQEYSRRRCDAVVSERALREIYLKGFEIAVKEGGAYAIMTTYAPLNGVWTAGHYDLCTRILREEWGFDGMVMSDWGADINAEGTPQHQNQFAAMVRAQNDLYMVVIDTTTRQGDLVDALQNGTLTRAALARCTANVLKMLLKSPALPRLLDRLSAEEKEALAAAEEDAGIYDGVECLTLEEVLDLPTDGICTDRGSEAVFGLHIPQPAEYTLYLQAKADVPDTAQVPLTAFINGTVRSTVTISGTGGNWVDLQLPLGRFMFEQYYLKLYFATGGMQIRRTQIRRNI